MTNVTQDNQNQDTENSADGAWAVADEKPESGGSNLRWVVFLLVGVFIFYVFIDSAVEGGAYFLEVDEAVAANLPSSRPVRVKGTVVAGTYKTKEGTSNHEFSIEGGGESAMKIVYDGPIPDVFDEGREVIVEGKLRNDGTLVATEVTAKCPSKYEGGISEEARESLQEKP